jgi:hypothetical protein
MKRLIRKLARSLWRMSAPVRQPVIHKIDRHLLQLLGTVSPRADSATNIDLAMNSVVRELARLQIQVEILQHQIEDLRSNAPKISRPETGLLIVGETD